jgi:hypothetical protein
VTVCFEDENAAYVCVWQLSEAYARAVFNNRSAGTREIDIHILALMHPELSARHYHHAILYSGDMCWATDDSTDEEGSTDIFDGQPGERSADLGREG